MIDHTRDARRSYFVRVYGQTAETSPIVPRQGKRARLLAELWKPSYFMGYPGRNCGSAEAESKSPHGVLRYFAGNMIADFEAAGNID